MKPSAKATKEGASPTTISKTGRRYGDRYQVERSIASGGMAEVFAARDELLERTVALKLMHPQFARDNTFINRFRREAQAAASINDPRVVSIYDWGSDNGDYYIVMEYVDGKTLREIIQNEGPMTPERAVEIAADICGALELAHQKGVIHRDIKSANIAVTSTGQTKIMDFGIARAAAGGETMTQTGSVIGTANYLSPEQAQGMPVDARSDIYSVGVVLYEMLTREVPFKGDTAVAIAYKHVQENAVPPSQLNPEVPAEVDAVVMKALAKNPDNRYSSALDMQADLQRILQGQQVEAVPILPPDQTAVIQTADRTTVLPAQTVPAGSSRRRMLAYVLATIFVLGILALLGFLLFSSINRAGPQIIVPEVVGLPQEEAERILTSRGLEATVDRQEFHDTVPAGAVISQDPEAERKAERGTRVNLVISRGPESVEVPVLVGKSREEAEALLQAAGLSIGEVAERSDDNVPAGRVLEQSPRAGAKLDRRGSVDLVVSKGQELIRVPEVVGLDESAARSRVEDAGLRAAFQDSCDNPDGTDRVVSQEPSARNEVPKNTTVTMRVNRGVAVPGVEGEDEAEATSELQEDGFRVVVSSRNAPGNEGDVIDQDPDANTTVCKGSTVRIVVGRSQPQSGRSPITGPSFLFP